MSVIRSGISVQTELSRLVTGTPTIGNHAEVDVLQVEVKVNDARLRQQLSSFDGFERVFALVPMRVESGEVKWNRIDLGKFHQERTGFFMQEFLDVHSSHQPLRGIDAEAIREHGIAIGLDTNVGTVWAQSPGENFRAGE
jgi:hypothetical protein